MHSKVEFHCHTANSFDCEVPLELRLKSYASLGFTHLAITDHDVVLSKKDRALISTCGAHLKVIPAIEVSTHVGHVILLNCRHKPLFNSLLFLVCWAKLWNAELYVPHPCRKGTGLLVEYVKNKVPTWYIAWFLSYVKYVEAWNPRDTIKDKLKVDSKIWLQLKKTCWTVASDSHFENDIHIDGCPLEGLRENDPLILRFFSQKIDMAEVHIPLTLRAALRYIKSALRYALR